MIFIEPMLKTSPEMLFPPGRKYSVEAWLHTMLEQKTYIKHDRNALFFSKVKNVFCCSLAPYMASQLDVGPLGRRAYLQRSTGMVSEKGRHSCLSLKSAFFPLGKCLKQMYSVCLVGQKSGCSGKNKV